MPFAATAGFNANLGASLSASSTQLFLSVADAAELMALLGGNFTFLQIQDGLSYEIVRANSVAGQLVSITRGIDNTSISAFPRGACVSFVMGPSSVAALSSGGGGGGNITVTSTNPLSAQINGQASVTTALPGPINITATPVSLTGPGVTGSFPNYVISGGGGGGAPDITADVNLLINNVLAGSATAFPITLGIGRNWVTRYSFGSFSSNTSSNNDATPSLGLTPFAGVTSPGTGLGVISGLALNASGRCFGVEIQTLPNGTFANAAVTVTNGRITAVTSSSNIDGGGTVTEAVAGAGITITGTPTIEPVINLTPTGVTAGVYGSVTINSFGQFSNVPVAFDPISSIVSPTQGVTISSVSPGVRQLLISSATDVTQGLVQFSDSTELTNFSPNVAMSPADFRTALNAKGRTVTQFFQNGGVAGSALSTVVASVNVAGPHNLVLITGHVQFLDPSLGVGNEWQVPFAAGIYVNGAPIIVTAAYPGGLRSLSGIAINATGLVEVRCTTPGVGMLVTGSVNVLCLNNIA